MPRRPHRLDHPGPSYLAWLAVSTALLAIVITAAALGD